MKHALLVWLGLGACGGRATTTTIPAGTHAIPVDDLPGRGTRATGSAGGSGGGPDRDGLAAKDPRIVDLDIIRIRGNSVGPEEAPIATTDLFRAANEAAKAGRTQDAIARYRSLVDSFPDSKYAPVALFDIAALYDGQADTAATITTLRELVTKYPDAHESIEGHLYIAALQADHQQWPEAAATLAEVLARSGLTEADRLEAHARAGYVALERRQYDAADASLDAAIADWRRAPHIDDPYYIAMAHYYRGEVLHRKFAAAPVRLPDTQLVVDLDAKRVLAARAYDRWKESLAFKQAYWATAAGYQMSQIFVELWDATVKAPLPTQLPGAVRAAYLNELHAKMHEHLVKALDGHQQNIELAKAFGVDTPWSQASATRAAQVMDLLAAEAKR